ncbi:hypothetical protein Tco_1014323, partial [Tanacetum coccineum]
MRRLKMPVFEDEIQGLSQHDQLRTALCMEAKALSWYRWSEGRTPFHSWDGFKRRLLIRFQQSQGDFFRAAVRVMNPEGLNNAMELAVSIEDNQQSKGVAAIVGQTTSKGDNIRRMTESEIQDRKAKGLCFRCEEKYTPGHQCASSTLQVLWIR